MKPDRHIVRRDRAPSLILLITMALLATASPGTTAAPSPTISFRAWLDNTCVGGWAPASSKVWVAWRDRDGRVKREGTVRASKKGKWSLCDSAERVQPGDKVQARGSGVKRTAEVPHIDISIDRDTDTVEGRAPGGAKVIIQHCYWRERFSDTYCDIHETISTGTGRYWVDTDASVVSVQNIRGGERVTVFVPRSGRRKDLFGRDQLAPFVDVRIGEAIVGGAFRPADELTLRLLDSDSREKATWTGRGEGFTKEWSSVYEGKVRVGGLFSGTFEAAGKAVDVAAGDTVTSSALPPPPGLPILDVHASVDADTDIIGGTCGTEERFDLAVTSPRSKRISLTALTGPDGSFSRDLSAKLDVVPGSVVTITCHHWTGDRTSVRVVAT